MIAFKSLGDQHTLFDKTSSFFELDPHLSNSKPPHFFSLGKVLVIICKNSSFAQVISGTNTFFPPKTASSSISLIAAVEVEGVYSSLDPLRHTIFTDQEVTFCFCLVLLYGAKL